MSIQNIDIASREIKDKISISEIMNKIKLVLPELREKYHVNEVGIFGSYARGEQTDTSDLDILIGFSEPIGLSIVDLKDDLEELIQIKIDLVSKNAIRRKDRLWKSISEDLLYA